MKVRTARLAAVLAAALLISTAMVAAAVEPAPPEAPVTSECSATAPGPAEVPGLALIAPEPVATADECETACVEAWAVCVNACPGNPEDPENEACRRDCLFDKNLCMNECWGGCHWLNPGC